MGLILSPLEPNSLSFFDLCGSLRTVARLFTEFGLLTLLARWIELNSDREDAGERLRVNDGKMPASDPRRFGLTFPVD